MQNINIAPNQASTRSIIYRQRLVALFNTLWRQLLLICLFKFIQNYTQNNILQYYKCSLWCFWQLLHWNGISNSNSVYLQHGWHIKRNARPGKISYSPLTMALCWISQCLQKGFLSVSQCISMLTKGFFLFSNPISGANRKAPRKTAKCRNGNKEIQNTNHDPVGKWYAPFGN